MFFPSRRWLLLCCTLATLFSASIAPAADLEECRQLYLHGQYEACIEQATSGAAGNVTSEAFAELKARAHWALGDYDQAYQTARGAIGRNPFSIRLRWLSVQLAPYVGEEKHVEDFSREIDTLVRNSAWRYSQDAANLITLAEFALAQGADAKQVQNVMLQRARKLDPAGREPILALGQLALEKRDFALAAEILGPARETFPGDPDILFGLARAMADSDPAQAAELLRQVLRHNPRHVEAMLTQAERLIDGEQYAAAMSRLNDVLAVNPHHPEALALRSVIAQLKGQAETAEEDHRRALAKWSANPRVDHLIGKKLSQKYRFEEGAAAQRRALALDAGYLPAKKHLAQDLLRLGQEDEGWELAAEVYRQDEYDVASYNLVTLRDELEHFSTIERDGFRIRMDAHEAEVYGERVVRLLRDARQTLCPKYGIDLPETIVVEIFPKPADFAVRTFGMPAAGAYLGVCFGDVITANSPASQQTHPVNWESVLWHEFAHVVTLNKTHNRMPRWLSEGISVYEERQRDPAWGEQMSPAYRQMILDGDLTPIGQLSNAFLSPKSSRHLMFAYFESSLVVEFLIKEYGLPALLSVLDDLGTGIPIEAALERHAAPVPQLDEEFTAFVELQTWLYGWYVDWSPADLAPLLQHPDATERLLSWARRHPRNYPGLKTCAELLLKLGQTQSARDVFQQAVDLFPNEAGADSPLAQLAMLQRQAGETDREVEALQRLAAIDSAAAAALLRLIDIGIAQQQWDALRGQALKLLAIKPLIPQPHAALAQAAEALADPAEAILALESLLKVSPPDLADVHFRLAMQYRAAGQSDLAKRHVLKALEQAPRFRAALALLLQLQDEPGAAPQKVPAAGF